MIISSKIDSVRKVHFLIAFNCEIPFSFWSPSSRGLGHRPFTAVTRVQIPLGTQGEVKAISTCFKAGPVAQLVSAPPCHGGGRGFKSRLGREIYFWLGSSVGTSERLKIVRSPVRSRPQPRKSLRLKSEFYLSDLEKKKTNKVNQKNPATIRMFRSGIFTKVIDIASKTNIEDSTHKVTAAILLLKPARTNR